MKLAKIGSAVVLMSSLLGSAAYASPYGAPAYNGPHQAAPVYAPPVHQAVAVPVASNWHDVDPGYHDGWRNGEVARFEQQQVKREADENARLARERADYARAHGYDARCMADFDRRQAEEKARFEQAQADRRQAFFNWMASEEQHAQRGHYTYG